MKDPDIQPTCYSVRRLNPFQGVVQVVQIESCRALSVNGTEWEIHVRTIKPDDMWGSDSPGEPVYQYIRFGHWDPGSGLKQVPANPLLNLTPLIERAHIITTLLKSVSQQLPFPLQDDYELWLLNQSQGQPMALLRSSVQPPASDSSVLAHWVALPRELQQLTAEQAGQQKNQARMIPGNYSRLSQLVNRNGNTMACRWYRRDGEGGVLFQTDPDCETADIRIPTDHFPELTITQKLENNEAQSLLNHYIRWQAPRLLTLQRLSDATRSRLETLAAEQVLEVNALWRLYPKCIDPDFITRSRVEARLRLSE